MTDAELIAQIIGFAAMGIAFFVPQQRTKARVLIVKLIADVFWVTHWGMLAAFSAKCVSLISCARSIVFFCLEKNGQKRSLWWLAAFLTAGVLTVSLSWGGWYSVFSLISGVVGTIGYWQKNVNHTKILMFVVSCSQIALSIVVGSWAALIAEIITVISLAIFLFRTLREKKRAADPEIGEKNVSEYDNDRNHRADHRLCRDGMERDDPAAENKNAHPDHQNVYRCIVDPPLDAARRLDGDGDHGGRVLPEHRVFHS